MRNIQLLILSITAMFISEVAYASYDNDIHGITTDCLVYENGSYRSIGNGAGIRITISTNRVVVYSARTQTFVMYNVSDWHTNSSGHQQFTADAIDNDGSTCRVRTVQRDDIEAPLQIYFHYSNITYVYNVILYR